MDVTMQHFKDTRDMRYGEIAVFRRAHIDIYNTTGMNDCPAALWDALDLEQLKQEHHAHRVIKNGPHFWMMDSNGIGVGETVNFGGLEARWVAKMGLLTARKAMHHADYDPFPVEKRQTMVYQAGKPIFELVDPEGRGYVLQARNEKWPIDSLETLGEHMEKLLEGWKYGTRTVTEDLVLDLGPDQTIYTVADEFLQYYTRIPETS
jgi:hypothetical protein